MQDVGDLSAYLAHDDYFAAQAVPVLQDLNSDLSFPADQTDTMDISTASTWSIQMTSAYSGSGCVCGARSELPCTCMMLQQPALGLSYGPHFEVRQSQESCFVASLEPIDDQVDESDQATGHITSHLESRRKSRRVRRSSRISPGRTSEPQRKSNRTHISSDTKQCLDAAFCLDPYPDTGQ